MSLALGLAACSFDTGGLGAADDDDDDAVDVDAAAMPDADPGDDDAGPTDTDDDGIVDADDNCPAIGNADQHNEDGDAHGDACDNCPHVENDDQADDQEDQNGEAPDGVGDVCDPRPKRGGDSIVFFDGFNGGALSGDWHVGASTGSNEWQVSQGLLVQPGYEIESNVLYWDGGDLDRVVVDAAIVIDDIVEPPPPNPGTDPPGFSRTAGIVAAFTDTATLGTGYGCVQWIDIREQAPQNLATVYRFDGDGFPATLATAMLPWDLDEDARYDYRMVFDSGSETAITCAYFAESEGPEIIPGSDQGYTSGKVGVRTFGIAAALPYFVVYQLGPAENDDSD